MMKTMNKFLRNTFLVALMATTAVMMSCTDDDPTEPTVTPDTTAPIITLIGNAEIMIGVGDTFTDPGATALDNEDGEISSNIVVTGSVDVNLAGSYTLAYNVSDAAGNAATEVTRSVTVSMTVVEDTEVPVITLLGDAEMMLAVGDSFTDPGATALDNKDGDISANITVTGTVDASTAATYTLAYNVSDAAGNAAVEMTRTVIVEEAGGGNEPSTAAPVPTEDASDVISIYSDSYTDISDVNTNPAWDQATQVSEVDFAGNMALKYTALNYQGTDWTTNVQDVSGKKYVHVDVWTADATTINFSLISTATTENAYALAIETGKWVSYDIELTAFTGVQLSTVDQIKIDDASAGNSPTLWLDNIYFYGTADGGGGGGSGTGTSIVNFENALTGIATGQFGAAVGAELIANPVSGGINTSANVFQITYTSGSDWWGGTELDFGPGVLDASATVYKAKLYSTVANSNVLFEVETASQVGTSGEVQTVVNANEWVEVTFTIPNPPSAVNRIIIRPDVTDLNGTKGNDGTLYIDDIVCESCTLGDGGGSGGGGGGDCPAPPAGDLVSNGGFESGEACWQFDVFPGSSVSTTVSNGGSNSAELQGSTGQAVGLKQERFAGGVLLPSTTYTVTFDIQADGAFGEGGVLKVFTFSEGIDGGNVGATQHVLADNISSIGTSWEQKTYNFTTPGTAPQVEGGLSFYIEIVNSSAKINLDNVSIK